MPRASSPTSRIFQVFLASPGDVLKERKYVEDVIAELNRTIAREKSIVIQTRRWELDTFPQAGSDVQKLINSQIADMASCKLFVGIMWNRCGTKTRRALSGTVEEYDRALKAKEKHKQPEIWFYFKEPKIVRPTNDQLHQLEQVNLFRGKVQSECLAFTFKTPSNFKDLFRNHLTLWLGKLQNAEIQRKEQKCRLNPYKLYYFRQTRKLSYTSLANATGVDRNSLRRMENIAPTQSAKLLSAEEFPEIDISTLATIERALDCHGKLSGGQADDFLSQYLLFYDTYKSISRKGGRKSPDTKQQDLRFRTQAVVFDFGGTLTETQGKHTTWERLWQKLGYSVNDCSELHRRYQRGLLTHQEWCDLT